MIATVTIYNDGIKCLTVVPAVQQTVSDDGETWSAVKASEIFKVIRELKGLPSDPAEEPEGYLAVRNGRLFSEVFPRADLALSWAAIAVDHVPIQGTKTTIALFEGATNTIGL